MKRIALFLFAAATALTLTCATFASDKNKDKSEDDYDAIAQSQADDSKYEWTSLFDGETLKNWVDNMDGGESAVKVKDGCLRLGMGPTTTSIHFDEEGSGIKLPTANYEVEYVAKRYDGSDFFAAMTFPIGKDFVTFVNGGWGGYVAGLSSIDDMDASENSTSSFYNFKTGKWYRFRVQVSEKTVRVWVNDEVIIDYPIVDHRITTRFEVEKSKPLGFASWVSTGLIKTIRLRSLSADEIKEMDARADENARYLELRP